MALVGYVDFITRAGIGGWAVNPDDPATPATVAVLVNGEERLQLHADQARPGLAASSKGVATDASAFAVRFDPPLSVFQEWRIEVVDVVTRALLTRGAHTLPQPSRDGAETPAPIIITSTGRAGTTLLMSEFTRHPGIVVADSYPYETKQIAYYASVFRALAAPADRTRSSNPDTMLGRERAHIAGSNPYNAPSSYDLSRPRTLLQTYYESRVPSLYAQTFRTLILEFYGILATSQGKSAAPYFCEKGHVDESVRLAARLFFPRVKELVLVRDPRDLLASAVSFWHQTPEQAMHFLEGALGRLRQVHAEGAADVLAVRYEDLVLDPYGSRRAIGEFLGLELRHDLPASGGAAMAAHRTSTDPLASIGRWRQDLTAEQIAECDNAFRRYMDAFGYRLAADWRAPTSVPPPADAAPTKPALPAVPPAAAAPPTSLAPLALAAEGPQPTAALYGGAAPPDGPPMETAISLAFGRDAEGNALLGAGWSRPEPGYVWTNAPQSALELPPLRGPGRYRVWLAGAPFTTPEKLPHQSVAVLANGNMVGSVRVHTVSVLSFDVPASDEKTVVTLRLPDARRPNELTNSQDDRLLGFCLRWARVLRLMPPPG